MLTATAGNEAEEYWGGGTVGEGEMGEGRGGERETETMFGGK